MHTILSTNLWPRVKAKAAKARRRQAVMAYVTSDLLSFKAGDLLVVDASTAAIKAGETDAKLLQKLARRGVAIYRCPNLHAKVLLLDDVAVIGSGNMSASSRDRLVEAAFMTDAPTVVSGVASLIEQIRAQSHRLTANELAELAKIKVVRHGFAPGQTTTKHKRPKISVTGKTTWLVGVFDEDRDLTAVEEAMVKKTEREIVKEDKIPESEISWIRWGGSAGVFGKKAVNGDQLVQICSERVNAKPTHVLKAASVRRVRRLRGQLFIFVRDPVGRRSQLSWAAFQRLNQRVGGPSRISGNSQRALSPVLADRLFEHWHTA